MLADAAGQPSLARNTGSRPRHCAQRSTRTCGRPWSPPVSDATCGTRRGSRSSSHAKQKWWEGMLSAHEMKKFSHLSPSPRGRRGPVAASSHLAAPRCLVSRQAHFPGHCSLLLRASTAACTWSPSKTSSCTPTATSALPSSAAAACALARSRSAITTHAPSAARRAAVALPMPDAAPVTSAMRVASGFGLGRRASLAFSSAQYSMRNFSLPPMGLYADSASAPTSR
jgi:hypothetical protein